MNAAHLSRIFKFINATAEHVVVADADTDNVFVVMPLEEYEELSGIYSEDEEPVEQEERIPLVSPKERSSVPLVRPASQPALPPSKPLPTVGSAPEHLEFNDAAWQADWENEFLAEGGTVPANPESEEEEEKFYLEPIE